MARTKLAALIEDEQVETPVDWSARLDVLENRIIELEEVITKLTTKTKTVSIQKVETYNGEEIPSMDEYQFGLKMNDQDKIISAINAAKILPPNLIVDGRHTAENIGAICGFIVDEEMLDEVYKQVKHEIE